MRTISAFLICIFSFAFAEGQTNTIKVKKIENNFECDCKEIIAKDQKGNSGDTLSLKKIGILKGKVIDRSNSAPVTDAVVEILFNGKIISASCSDSLGNYATRPMSPNKYLIRVKKCGYKTRGLNSVEVSAVRTAFQDIFLTPVLEKKKP